jgi:beta-barrel assembly-enhancing protease
LKPGFPKRPFAVLTLILFLTQSTIGHGIVDLPSIGEATESYLSTEQEQYYGEAFMRSIRGSLDLVDDPEIQAYIESLGNRLVANTGIRDRKFTFFVIRDPMINAFAGPGGYIGINTGLILTTHTEAELASVVAHEIAHVTQRHIARAFEAASRMSVPVTAAIIAAIILGARGGSQVGEAAIAASMAGSVQQQINFTRANEQEADRIGLQILADSGFEPRAMPRFFERLQQASQFYDNLQLEFLRTHPVTISRISDTGNRAEQYPNLSETLNPNYHLIREKVRIIQHANPRLSVEHYAGALPDIPEGRQESARYGYALALQQMGRIEEARAQLEPLIARAPEHIPFQIALAELEMSAGNIDRALGIYTHNLGLYPYHLPLTLYYVHALLQDRQASAAIGVINDYHRARSPRAELYRQLAQARNMIGEQSESHQALADYHQTLGETRAAIEQLKLALRTMRAEDSHREARLRARIELLEEEWKNKAKVVGEAAQ